MAYLLENNAYKVWQITEKSWKNLYDLLYTQYYTGGKIELNDNLDKPMVYRLMKIAEKYKNSGANFPQTHDQFYEILNNELNRLS